MNTCVQTHLLSFVATCISYAIRYSAVSFSFLEMMINSNNSNNNNKMWWSGKRKIWEIEICDSLKLKRKLLSVHNWVVCRLWFCCVERRSFRCDQVSQSNEIFLLPHTSCDLPVEMISVRLNWARLAPLETDLCPTKKKRIPLSRSSTITLIVQYGSGI